MSSIKRPLQRTRTNNEEKVQALMASIEADGLKEPIDVLDVDGKYYGFSGAPCLYCAKSKRTCHAPTSIDHITSP